MFPIKCLSTQPFWCFFESEFEAAADMPHGKEGVEVRVARIFNTFGARMHMNDGRVVYGSGSQTRAFQYVRRSEGRRIWKFLVAGGPPQKHEAQWRARKSRTLRRAPSRQDTLPPPTPPSHCNRCGAWSPPPVTA
ncbi:hypothetical protein JZ751_028998, partial [Albula glossodonta]